jgi:hypothetical protein
VVEGRLLAGFEALARLLCLPLACLPGSRRPPAAIRVRGSRFARLPGLGRLSAFPPRSLRRPLSRAFRRCAGSVVRSLRRLPGSARLPCLRRLPGSGVFEGRGALPVSRRFAGLILLYYKHSLYTSITTFLACSRRPVCSCSRSRRSRVRVRGARRVRGSRRSVCSRSRRPGVFLIGAGRWRTLGMCGRCLACAAACEGT